MNLPPEHEQQLRLLCDHLDNPDQQNDDSWQDWQITRPDGGANNQLFRVKYAFGDFVIKFTIQDERNRAEREFQALSAIKQAGLKISPLPVFLDKTSYRQPVMVQTWIEGECLAHPPITDEEWLDLLQHFVAIHSVTPSSISINLSNAESASTVAGGYALVNEQLSKLPKEARPAILQDLIRRFEQTEIQEWEMPPVTLCRIDPNLSNFIRTRNGLISVDWEYSGWGDPAYDIADLISHPKYMEIPTSRWDWLKQAYSDLADDATATIRIETYCKFLQIWWVVRSARYMYEIPRGL